MTTLGTFWDLLPDKALISAYLIAKQQTELQTQEDVNNLMKCASRYETPIHVTKLLEPIVINKSYYDNSPLIELPSTLSTPNIITDAIVAPSVVWLEHYDYSYADGILELRVNPFEIPTIDKAPIKDDSGQIVDYSITLWFNNSKYDEEYIHTFWGNLVNLYAASSDEYRQLVCAVLDCLLLGTTTERLEKVLSLYYDAPIAKEEETIETIIKQGANTLVITDKHVYRCNPCNRLLVTEGQALRCADPLTDRCLLYYPTQIPYNELVEKVTIPASYFKYDIQGDLAFINQDVPVEVIDGQRRFSIMGDAESVNMFWEVFYNTGGSLEGIDSINPCSYLCSVYVGQKLLICVTGKDATVDPKLAGIDIRDVFQQIIMPAEGLLITNNYE